jgi:hypothetical protein
MDEMAVRGIFQELNELAFGLLTSQEQQETLAKEPLELFDLWIFVGFFIPGVECSDSELNFRLKSLSGPQVYVVVVVNFHTI